MLGCGAVSSRAEPTVVRNVLFALTAVATLAAMGCQLAHSQREIHPEPWLAGPPLPESSQLIPEKRSENPASPTQLGEARRVDPGTDSELDLDEQSLRELCARDWLADPHVQPAVAFEPVFATNRETLSFPEFISQEDLEPPRLPDLTYAELVRSQAAGVWGDFREFYSVEGLTWLMFGVCGGAAMANTGFDEHFLRDKYVETIILSPNDELFDFLHQPKFLGDGYYTIPVFAVTALAAPLIDEFRGGPEISRWGQNSLRTILVGGPPMLALQWITGGSRPTEDPRGSYWLPFNDNNGVSGHSFMGAIPFISAAKMTDNPWLKSGLYVASALPGLSRVNDDDHFFSQAFLGWWLAYMAASAVDRSNNPDANHHFLFFTQGTAVMAGYEFRR